MAAALFIIAFASCSKDDDNKTIEATPITATTIAGKWEYERMQYINYGHANPEIAYPNKSGCSKDYMVLDSTGNYTNVTYSSYCDPTSQQGSWTLSTETVAIVTSTESASFDVLAVTPSALTIRYSSYDQDGQTVDIEVLKFTRALMQN